MIIVQKTCQFHFCKNFFTYLYFTPANLGVYYLYNEKVDVRSSWIKQNHLKKHTSQCQIISKDIAFSLINSRGSFISNHPGPFILESISKSSKLKYNITVYNILPPQNFTRKFIMYMHSIYAGFFQTYNFISIHVKIQLWYSKFLISP